MLLLFIEQNAIFKSVTIYSYKIVVCYLFFGRIEININEVYSVDFFGGNVVDYVVGNSVNLKLKGNYLFRKIYLIDCLNHGESWTIVQIMNELIKEKNNG